MKLSGLGKVGETRTDSLMPGFRFSPRKRNQAELCADPKEAWVQRLMQRLDTPPVPRKPVQRCKKDKSGKKRKGSKGCKR